MISERMRALGESGSVIREIAAYGAARKQEIGEENVFDFSIGNPSVPAPEKVREAISRLAAEADSVQLHGYTAAEGAMATREAAAREESLRAGYALPADCVYMTCGASASLSITLRAMCCSGEKVVIFAPFFPEYQVFIENAGARSVVVPPSDSGMQPDLSALAQVVDENVKAVLINSPNNPSGAVYSAETLRALARVLTAASERFGHAIYLIADEPYRELVYDGVTAPFVPNFYKNTVICYSYSKSISLPGERIGYILVPPCVEEWESVFAALCGAGRSMGFLCAPSLFQSVVAECAQERSNLGVYDENRRLLYDGLTAMGYTCVKPQGAFYLFMQAPGGNAEEFCEKAKKFELLLVPSDSFGMPGYVRIAYCTATEMTKRALPAFRRLAEECL